MSQRHIWWVRFYRNQILVLGIILTAFGIYQLPTICTFKSELTPLKGTIRSADTYVSSYRDRRGHESQKSELIFYLNERNQKYYFAENIGDAFRDDKYEKILAGLKQSDSVTVWIKKSAITEFEPQVFQIDNGEKTLLGFEMVRTDKGLLTIFLLFAGLGSIAYFFWFRYPDKFRRLLGYHELTNH